MQPSDLHEVLRQAIESQPLPRQGARERVAVRARRYRVRRRVRTAAAGVAVVAAGTTGLVIASVHDGTQTVTVTAPPGSSVPNPEPPQDPILSEALKAWAGFPVNAMPRPLVLMNGPVNPPAGGFTTNALKEAFEQGTIKGPASLPAGPSSADGYPLDSPAAALRVLSTPSGPTADVPPLQVTKTTLGTASFQTDRGIQTLPAWLFTFSGVANPAAVLAVDPSSIYIAPAAIQSSGSPSAGSAELGANGETLTVNIAGYPAGGGDCTADYTVSAAESPNAIALQVIEHRHGDPNANCATSATLRQAKVSLKSLLGNRVVVDAATHNPVIVTGTASSTSTVATRLCAMAFGTHYLNSAAGTVTDVRTLSIGPGYRPGKDAFTGMAGTHTIAWCWTGIQGNYTLYAVAQGQRPVKIEGVRGQQATQPPAPGPAPIP